MSRDIIGLAALEAAAWGSSVMAPIPGGTFNARDLPRSFAGFRAPMMTTQGQVEVVQVSVQREFRPDRLTLCPTVTEVGGSPSPDYRGSVMDIRVGTISINASPNPVAVRCFAPWAVGVSIRAPVTATPSIGIQLHIRCDVPATGDGYVWAAWGGFTGPSAAPNAGLGAPAAGTVGAIVGQDPADDGVSASDLPQSMVGLPEVTLVANTRQYVQVPIQRDVRPDRLILPYAAAGTDSVEAPFPFPVTALLVYDIRVGTISLNITMEPASSALFSEMSFGNRLRAVATATPAIGIGLELAAIGVNQQLRGGIFGPSRYASS